MGLLSSIAGTNNLTKENVVVDPVGNLPTPNKLPSLEGIETVKIPAKPTYMSRSQSETMIQSAARAEHDAKCAVRGYKAAAKQIEADTKVTLAHHDFLKVATVEALKRAKSASEVAKLLTGASVAYAQLGDEFEANKTHAQNAIQNARD